MKLTLILGILFFAFSGLSQSMTWEQRYENAVYFVSTMNDDESYQIKITKTNGNFSDSERQIISDLCLRDDVQAIYKLVSIEAHRITIYHTSGMDRYDFEMLFSEAFGGGYVEVGDRIPHPIH